ncbi:MAG: polysaccharide deacetylase family protein [Acidobacteriota bacterium]|nr:polysaccharide deacetylase family protein [Acidobacteriota bacterium]
MSILRSLYVNWRRRRIYRRALAGPARGVILRYHSVGRPEEVGAYLDPGLSVSPERFREHLELLRRHCRVVGPAEMSARLQGGAEGPLAVWITFDDGYRDNHDQATTLLAEAGLTATFYITTGPLFSGRGLWISELWRLVPRLPAGAATGLPEALPGQVPAAAEGRRLLRRRVTRWFAGMTAEEREGWLDHLAALAGLPRGEGLEQSFLTPDMLRPCRRPG